MKKSEESLQDLQDTMKRTLWEFQEEKRRNKRQKVHSKK